MHIICKQVSKGQKPIMELSKKNNSGKVTLNETVHYVVIKSSRFKLLAQSLANHQKQLQSPN